MYKYSCLNVMKEEALKLFKDDYTKTEGLDADILLVRSTNLNENPVLPKSVQFIGRAGIGVNTIPFKEYAKQGIVVCNTPGGNANSVKELTTLSLVLAQRDVFGANEWVKSLADDPNIVEIVEKKKTMYTGTEIQGKTLGVIGLGAIGGIVANIAFELGMDVIGYDPYISVEHAWAVSKFIKKVNSLDEVLANSDIITVHTPLKDDTKNMLNKKAFAKMKDGVKIINLARAAIVNDEDMAEALESGKVAKFITDFPNPKTVKMKNTIVFPHIGGASDESETKCTAMAVRQAMDYIENGNIANSVNYPDVNAGKCMTKQRVTVFHKNISGMISQFTDAFTGNNIAKMVSNSLDDVAYAVFDLDDYVSDDTIKLLENIPNVIRVRKLRGMK